ncbi:MAG: hypothetical protein AAFO29_18070, partial [Actinomycetota bacterium]
HGQEGFLAMGLAPWRPVWICHGRHHGRLRCCCASVSPSKVGMPLCYRTTVFDAEKTLAATIGSSLLTREADRIDAPPQPTTWGATDRPSRR